VFADTLYWIALISPRDQWRSRALKASGSLAQARLMTTEDVLIEVLNSFAEWGGQVRRAATSNVRAILSNSNIEVAIQSHDRFIAGLELYESREDKGYSLTDCISMNIMREHGLSDVLTHDEHFRQEGFNVLL
jgi:predicted nucleic acid-binding protein